MNKPPDGLWTGVAVNLRNGNTEVVKVKLLFRDDGSIEGNLISSEPDKAKARAGEAPIQGRYSLYGSIHLHYAAGDSNVALFDGLFRLPEEKNGIIFGSLWLKGKDVSTPGSASLHFVKEVPQKANGHVWSN